MPSAACLVIRALKEPCVARVGGPARAAASVTRAARRPRNRKVDKNIKHLGNLTLNDVYGIARTMRPRSLAKEFSGTVKEILGRLIRCARARAHVCVCVCVCVCVRANIADVWRAALQARASRSAARSTVRRRTI